LLPYPQPFLPDLPPLRETAGAPLHQPTNDRR